MGKKNSGRGNTHFIDSVRGDAPPGMLTKKDFVRKVGISPSTLQRLRRLGVVHPTSVTRGALRIYLYDDKNFQEITDHNRRKQK